jgi:hypothetical protein
MYMASNDLHQSVSDALIAPRKSHTRAALLRYVFASELARGDCKPIRQFFDTSCAAAPEAATSLLSAS